MGSFSSGFMSLLPSFCDTAPQIESFNAVLQQFYELSTELTYTDSVRQQRITNQVTSLIALDKLLIFSLKLWPSMLPNLMSAGNRGSIRKSASK